jgi:site-specific recombinase XerD
VSLVVIFLLVHGRAARLQGGDGGGSSRLINPIWRCWFRAEVGQIVELSGQPRRLGWGSRSIRHACGFALANAGRDTRALQAYLGHRNIQHTVHYTELAPDRFKGFWSD